MTRWDTDNLNAPHTQRELQQEFGCNLVDQLREVTGGKLAYTNTSNALRLKAADRIEQLERELEASMLATQHANDHADAAIADLAAEKALADQAANLINGDAVGIEWKRECTAFLVAHRKARGL